MILIVGHGPSSNVDPDWINEQEMVIRCHTGTHKQGAVYCPHIGSKVDIIVCTRPKTNFWSAGDGKPVPVWYEAKYREKVREISDQFTREDRRKLSTGTVACVVARMKHPDAEIGVIGFDTTMGGIYYNNWPYHDADGEGRLLQHIGIKDYGIYDEDLRVQR